MLHTRVMLPNEEAIMSRSAEIREAPVCVFKDPKSSIYLTHILGVPWIFLNKFHSHWSRDFFTLIFFKLRLSYD